MRVRAGVSDPLATPSEGPDLRSLLDALPDAVLLLDEGRRLSDVNTAAERRLGRSRHAILGSTFTDVLPQATRELILAIERVDSSGIPATFEGNSPWEPGSPVEIQVFRWGALIAVSIRDVVESGQARAALRESRVRLEIATSAAELGVWEYNLVTGAMTYSKRAREILGLPSDARVTLRMVRRATHPEDRALTAAAARRAIDPALRERAACEYRVIRNRSTRWVLAHGEVVFGGPSGAEKALRYIGTLQDITDRRAADIAVRESEARLRLALEAGRMAVWSYDVATRALQGSAALNGVLGFPPGAEPSLTELNACYYPGEQQRVYEAGRSALARGERFFQAEYRWIRPSGATRWLMLRAEIKLGDTGAANSVVGVVLDVTERKQAEAQQQLMIHELNHRVKNTLATVQSLAAQSFRGGGSTDEMLRSFDARLLALSRAHDVLTRENWTGAAISEVVQEVIAPYREGGTRFDVAGPEVAISSRLALSLSMALHELATNAIKYGALSVPSGTVAVRWSRREADGKLILTWTESGGPPVVPPSRQGFGTRLIRRGLAAEIGGSIDLVFAPTGVVCTIAAALTGAAAPSGTAGTEPHL